jgi:hypothetical protein
MQGDFQSGWIGLLIVFGLICLMSCACAVCDDRRCLDLMYIVAFVAAAFLVF